jgi:transposase
MRPTDGRKLSHATLEELRIRAVQRVEAGESPEDVIRALGFSRPRIYEWLAAYREGGVDALRAKPVPGRPMKLPAHAIQFIYETVTTKTPFQLRFEFALWTREMVRELIRNFYNVRLSEVSVGRLLRKLGLSPQRPLARAYQRDPEQVETWLRDEYPAIVKEAKRVGAKIFFGDEANVRSDYHSGTTWAKVGETPIVDRTGARFKLNILSAISPRGELRFMCEEGRVTSQVFLRFLERLMHKAEQPIFLILDGHPIHHSSAVKRFVEQQAGQLRIFRLPSYSPDLNPDELVWRHLKTQKIGRMAIRGPRHMKRLVISIMRRLQKLPALVRSLFHHPSTRYTLA